MKTRHLTTAQALIAFLKQQYIERDDAPPNRSAGACAVAAPQPFFAGCFGIFGHGNLAGIGEALQENPDFRYLQARNEQAMVHTAVAYARAKDRMQTWACTSSIGPGATNMVTGAALATINRLPVLLLPGDIFANRSVGSVLQQLESGASQDVSVNDCFKPVSKYWDRVNRPEQLMSAMTEAMRVLTSPGETGAVTICLPQDVQAEAFDFPEEFFERRVWTVPRARADKRQMERAAQWIRASRKPIIVAGGGVIYSGACEALAEFASATGIAVGETQAGKGALHWQHPSNLGAIGATGTPGANLMARYADLVIGIGTRYSDFTTASRTAFANEDVRFININVSEFDSSKHNALALTGDAKAVLEELSGILKYKTSNQYEQTIKRHQADWFRLADEHLHPASQQSLTAPSASSTQSSDQQAVGGRRNAPALHQAEVIGIVAEVAEPRDVVVCAAGSLPGDLHKLWRAGDPKSYHVEYGYSCMGYEIAGGIGIKMAQPDRRVFVMVGDASYLMMAQELVSAAEQKIPLTVVLIDNHGYASIGSLSRSVGSEGFGTAFQLPLDFVKNAEGMGAKAVRANTRDELTKALMDAVEHEGPTVIVVNTDTSRKVPGYESWWDVPVAEASTLPAVQAARTTYEAASKAKRSYFKATQGEPTKQKQEAVTK